MRSIGLFTVKVPFLAVASVVLPALGILTLPVMLPVGLLWAKRTNNILKEVDETGQEGVASLVVSIGVCLAMLPAIGFIAPVMLWWNAIATLKEGLS